MSADGSDSITLRFKRRRLEEAPVVALVVTVLAVGGFLLVQHVVSAFGADEGKARREVQRWYDERWPGRIAVSRCDYAPQSDSDYSAFECHIRVVCPDPAVFFVPRAGNMTRIDSDPVPMRRSEVGRDC